MKHFLVVAMLMVSASCVAFGLQPNKAVESFSWKWNWIQHETSPMFNLICPRCGHSDFVGTPTEEDETIWVFQCTNCPFSIKAKQVGTMTGKIDKDKQKKDTP